MVKLKDLNKVHFTGIKGVGMTALALCCQDLGILISGSDVEEKFVTDAVLEQRGIGWQVGFNPDNISDQDLVVYTGAHGGADNVEVKAAQENGILAFSHAKALAFMMNHKKGISVCGVGGKTTTSAMIANTMQDCGLQPSYAIGAGQIKPLGHPGKYDPEGEYFIAEADEYFVSPQIKKPRFCYQKPEIVVVTNIEYDHPDVYKNVDQTIKEFRSFFSCISEDGLIVACSDNENVRRAIKQLNKQVVTYGFNDNSDWQLHDYQVEDQQAHFLLTSREDQQYKISLSVPGRFNALNSAACFIVNHQLGVDADKIITSLENFYGVERRFDFVGQAGGNLVYDDYAHHPMEIERTLNAAKEWFKDREITVIFQPHTFSRTKALLGQFAKSFQSAEEVVITDIYSSAREEKNDEVSSKELAEKTRFYNPQTIHLSNKQAVCQYLKQSSYKNNVVITMGAGDIFTWHKELINCLQKKEPASEN
jgi:UDP-N-acetylmuramate--alanine ligase